MDRRRRGGGLLSASKLLKDIAPIEDVEGDIAMGKDNDYVVEQDSYFGGNDSDSSGTKRRSTMKKKVMGSKYKKRSNIDGPSGSNGVVVKKRKYTRKIKYSSDSDDSDNLAGEGGDPEWGKQSKLESKDKIMLSKQIKQLSKIAGLSDHIPSAGSGGSETEKKNEDGTVVMVKKEKGGRRDIRGILHKKELAEETKNAEKEEHERKKRMAAFQTLYNGLFKEPGTDESIDRFVLDFDVETKEPTVEVNRKIVSKLKPHQTKGIMFMWKSCFETLDQFKENPDGGGSGGILGHCMGLGKTLQSIAFLHTIMTHPDLKEHVKRILVICPLNTVGNWAKEFDLWLDEDLKKDILVHNLWEGVGPHGKFQACKDWMKYGGVGIINYDAFRGLITGTSSYRVFFRKALVNPGPALVICDEGHLLKNEKSQSSKALNEIRTLRRIILTGTPLQNNLLEYYTMMSFVKPNLLGTLKEFCNRFVNPIINGQHKDSTERDVRIMKRRAHVLHKLLDSSVQRLDHTVLVPYLPPKQEFVIFVNLTDIQNQLYQYYLSEVAKIKTTVDVAERMRKRGNFFCDYNTLQKVWTHPYLLTYLKEKKLKSGEEYIDEEEIMNNFIFDDGENSNNSASILSVLGANAKIRGNQQNSQNLQNSSKLDQINSRPLGGLLKWWESFFPQGHDSLDKIELSGKLLMLVEIIRKCIEIGDKLLVFSQYISTLDVIELFLNEVELSDGHSWEKNRDYFRIDGSVNTENRQRSLDSFNLEGDSSKAKVFLISTRAGGLGVNLCGANRVVIFDVSWNPSTDLQSIFRVYRFGQKKPVYIYRLISDMSMEEKVYNRQVIKLSLAKRVVDEQQIERHFRFNDVYLMYGFNPDGYRNSVTPIYPANDKLLADVLDKKRNLVYNVLEHESLLVNKVDEILSPEERKAAWEDYIIERDMPDEDDSSNSNNNNNSNDNNGGNNGNGKKNGNRGFPNRNGFGKKGKLFNFARGWIEASFYGKNIKVTDDAMKDIIESLKIDIESLIDLNSMISPSAQGVSQLLVETKIDILRRMCHILFLLPMERDCRDIPTLEGLMLTSGYDIGKAPLDKKK